MSLSIVIQSPAEQRLMSGPGAVQFFFSISSPSLLSTPELPSLRANSPSTTCASRTDGVTVGVAPEATGQ
jgi:hypothetical protein